MCIRSNVVLVLLVFYVAGCSKKVEPSLSIDSSKSTAVTSASGSADTADVRQSATNHQDTLTQRDSAHWQSYQDMNYHFEFQYPAGLHPTMPFNVRDLLTSNWRAMATEGERGKQVISIPIYRIGDRTAYPRFYDVEFRVGVSDDPATCKMSNGERSIGKVTINGITFDQYEFSDAAMMKYVSGISYRTIHNGHCFAIEQIRSGSNYRDVPSPKDMDQKVLDSYYYLAGKIVKTFRFVK